MKRSSCLPHLLSRHDERAIDVSVLDEAFSVGQAKFLGQVKRGCSRSVWHLSSDQVRTHDERDETDWNDHIDRDLLLLENSTDFLCEEVSHRHSTPVDRDAIEYRVGTGEVDIFEDIGCEYLVFDELFSGNCCTGNDDGLPCRSSVRCVRRETDGERQPYLPLRLPNM